MSIIAFLLTFQDWVDVVQWVSNNDTAPDNLAAAYAFSNHCLSCNVAKVETNILERRSCALQAWADMSSKLNFDEPFDERGLADCLKCEDWIHSTSQFLSVRVFSRAPEAWLHIAAILHELNKPREQPRIRASTTLLKKVETHFTTKPLKTISMLEIYETMLPDTPRAIIVDFLFAVENKSAEDDFYTMPPDIVSTCIGRGRNPDDQLQELRKVEGDLVGPRRPLKGLPSFIALDSSCTLHYIFRGRVHSSLQSLANSVFATVPTTNTCEQHVVECDSAGMCRLIAASAGGVEVTNTFKLDIEERLDWVDVRRNSQNALVLEWGGNDSLRGSESWSCWAGLNEQMLDGEGETLFVECEAPVLVGACDFSRHGNRLSVLRRHADRDDGKTRTWTRDQFVFEGSCIVDMDDDLRSCSAVWGAPEQYVAVHANGVAVLKTLQRGGNITKLPFAVPPNIVRLAVLPCFSR